MLELKRNKKWVVLFIAVSVLILMQVLWWTTVFLRTVDKVADLERTVIKLSPGLGNLKAIEEHLFHSKFMFLSEGITFSVLICFGLYLLFRSLKAEQKTLEMQRNFTEILTHESKTPLTALKLRLENLLEIQGGNEVLTKETKLSLDEVRRLSSIIEKAISLNRIEANHFVFDEVSVEEVVQQVVKRLDPLFKSRNVKLHVELKEEILVRADFLALQNSIQSLIENAVYYNDKEAKTVTVAASKHENGVRLTVSDNGPGIQFKEQEKIFERFYRGASGRRVPGTGLGLYLTRLIVEAHKGAIRLVDSSAQGSRFEMFIPSLKGAE